MFCVSVVSEERKIQKTCCQEPSSLFGSFFNIMSASPRMTNTCPLLVGRTAQGSKFRNRQRWWNCKVSTNDKSYHGVSVRQRRRNQSHQHGHPSRDTLSSRRDTSGGGNNNNDTNGTVALAWVNDLFVCLFVCEKKTFPTQRLTCLFCQFLWTALDDYEYNNGFFASSRDSRRCCHYEQ